MVTRFLSKVWECPFIGRTPNNSILRPYLLTQVPSRAFDVASEPIGILHDWFTSEIPKQTRVVICGGGVVGCSVAYHLAVSHNWKDVVLLEQGRLGGGTTWHGAGLLGQIKPTTIETKMCQYSIGLYKDLENRGLTTGWKGCGSLLLARTKDRMISFQRLAASAEAMNIECELLTPQGAAKISPIISTEDLEGGLWIPGDGVGDPYKCCLTLATEAQNLGVKVIEGCFVQRVLTDDHHQVKGVETNLGVISCDYFVNSGGWWARHIGKLSQPKVKVPLYPCEHHFLHTLPVKDIDLQMPVIRDYDGHFYIRENQGRYLAGGFEPISKPLDLKELPGSFKPLTEDWDQFYVLLEQMLFRIPSLAEVEVDRLCNGPESFTPDCKWIMGEAPEVKNYFVASGMKSIGIEAAGGIGKLTSDWIVSGEPATDIWDLDIRRFIGLHNNLMFLKARMREVPGMHYRLKYPFTEFETGRCLRMSPIYPRLKVAGAFFSQNMGYEKPAYFDLDTGAPADTLECDRIAHTRTFHKPPWFNNVWSEYTACRERVGLLDYSSFTKLELWSPGCEVVSLLQYLCSNDVDIPIGCITHTGMQNKWGGYENDCSLVRLGENFYMLIGPTDQQMRCQTWIKRHLPVDSPVVVADVTSMYTAICVMGPRARDLMTELTDSSMTSRDFPFFTCKIMDIGLASGIKVMNLTHTGELGWVLYIPNEYALHVYDLLVDVGAKYEIKHVGYYAMRTLRIEKFYAFWGKDMDTTTTPLECGRGFRVKFDKGDFMGKEALLKQKNEGVKRRYIQLVLEDHDIHNDVWPWGGEPIYLGDRCIGLTTTTGYGFTMGKQVCLGFIQNLDSSGNPQIVTNDYILKNTFHVVIGGKFFPAKANIHSPALSFIEYGYDSAYMATRADPGR